MATFGKNDLSGSTNGRSIKITTTGTPGDLIHTSVSGEVNWDEIYLFAVNHDSSDRTITVEWGGVTSPDDLVPHVLEVGKGAYVVIPGWMLQNGLIVRAWASAANVVTVNGFVHNIVAA